MPCLRIPNGFLCVPNEPVTVAYNGRRYWFQWTAACGWFPLKADGSERIAPVPDAVWKKLETEGTSDER